MVTFGGITGHAAAAGRDAVPGLGTPDAAGPADHGIGVRSTAPSDTTLTESLPISGRSEHDLLRRQ
jgi:hypothetical protein